MIKRNRRVCELQLLRMSARNLRESILPRAWLFFKDTIDFQVTLFNWFYSGANLQELRMPFFHRVCFNTEQNQRAQLISFTFSKYMRSIARSAQHDKGI